MWDKIKDSDPCLKGRADISRLPKEDENPSGSQQSHLVVKSQSGVLREDTCIGNSGDL